MPDPAEPMPHYRIVSFILSSITGENVGSPGSLNAYIIARNKRNTVTETRKEKLASKTQN